MSNDNSNKINDIREMADRLDLLESKLEDQLDRKEYQLALMTTEELIELSGDLDQFSIDKWMNYYSQLKEHLFMKTFDEKYSILVNILQRQEIITIRRFQNLMKLDFVDDFKNIVKSLPETQIYTLLGNQLSFTNPGEHLMGEKIDEFLNNLYMILQ